MSTITLPQQSLYLPNSKINYTLKYSYTLYLIPLSTPYGCILNYNFFCIFSYVCYVILSFINLNIVLDFAFFLVTKICIMVITVYISPELIHISRHATFNEVVFSLAVSTMTPLGDHILRPEQVNILVPSTR